MIRFYGELVEAVVLTEVKLRRIRAGRLGERSCLRDRALRKEAYTHCIAGVVRK
jgi:hypothetical protein